MDDLRADTFSAKRRAKSDVGLIRDATAMVVAGFGEHKEAKDQCNQAARRAGPDVAEMIFARYGAKSQQAAEPRVAGVAAESLIWGLECDESRAGMDRFPSMICGLFSPVDKTALRCTGLLLSFLGKKTRREQLEQKRMGGAGAWSAFAP